MRDEQHERVTNDGKKIKRQERAPMAPSIDQYSAGIGVDRAEQSAQGVVETNNENARANYLKILWDETHPKLFTGSDDKDCNEEDDEIALQREKLCHAMRACQGSFSRRLHSAKRASYTMNSRWRIS